MKWYLGPEVTWCYLKHSTVFKKPTYCLRPVHHEVPDIHFISTSNFLDTRLQYHDSYVLEQQKQLNHIYHYIKNPKGKFYSDLQFINYVLRLSQCSSTENQSRSNLSLDLSPLHYGK